MFKNPMKMTHKSDLNQNKFFYLYCYIFLYFYLFFTTTNFRGEIKVFKILKEEDEEDFA